ncbi:MAG: MmgE/PrpD family protein [Streptosporangiales bacterium]|nr:MmgE/PrpD family protein [Streptosporangiales bacterium]
MQHLADLAVRIREQGLPAALREDVARRVLDLTGNALAATTEEPARAVGAVARGWGGAAQATAIGSAVRLPAPAAALVNGTLAHALDFDDTHLPSVLHPSSSVIPAALAVAETHGRGGAELLDAAGVGIEATVRIGMAGYDPALGNSIFFERGLHATSICGTIGAAIAAGMLLGLDADGIASAAGVAASMGAGVIEANRTGGTVKRVHCGWAAHAGVAAAELAAHGITGPPTVLEGRFGFLQAYCGDGARPEAITDGLGEEWELPGIFFKPYPCNHFTHAGIDAARRLREGGLDPADIASIELGAASAVLRTIGEPAAAKARPESGYHAAFSGPYTVAAALLGGGGLGVFHEDFTDAAAKNPERLALAAKVRCVPDARCDEIFPHQFPAVLRVTRTDGTLLEERVNVNRGGPGNPLSAHELATKFHGNATRTVDETTATILTEAAFTLPTLANLTPLTTHLRPHDQQIGGRNL